LHIDQPLARGNPVLGWYDEAETQIPGGRDLPCAAPSLIRVPQRAEEPAL
jgi:hypothetical protein